MGTEAPFTSADVTAFGTKLTAWGESLPANERAILAEVLARASGAAADLQGFQWKSDHLQSSIFNQELQINAATLAQQARPNPHSQSQAVLRHFLDTMGQVGAAVGSI